MYENHFLLQQKPFTLTPNTEFFFNQKSHRNALNTLLLALRHSEGFIKIVGEVGTGKTLLCRKLLSMLGDDFITAYIPNPYLTPDELKGFLAEEIGLSVTERQASYQILSDIYRRLIQLAKKGKQVVLVIDEAQAMPIATIEALRLLTNLETETRKLLQVVLLGQPELDAMLARPELRQLNQRIVFSEYLKPLDLHSTRRYLNYRISAASGQKKLFSNAASFAIALASGGTPRLINILAHKAMLGAFGLGDRCITVSHVTRAIRDTSEVRWLGKLVPWRWHFFWPAVGMVAAAAPLLLLT